MTMTMANARHTQTSLWLRNKLGSNESWTSESISSQFNTQVLGDIKDCFTGLEPIVQLRLLLSFLHLPKESMNEWKLELKEILELAQAETEQWVSMLAEFLKSFLTTNSFHTDLNEPENKLVFDHFVEEVKYSMERSELNLMPIECHYLNRRVLSEVLGPQVGDVKLFNLKSKPKTKMLQMDILKRLSDATNSSKELLIKPISAIPTPFRTGGILRKIANTSPLKGIPSSTSCGNKIIDGPIDLSFKKNFTRPPQREGGTKAVDIPEVPFGNPETEIKRQKMLRSEQNRRYRLKKKRLSGKDETHPGNEGNSEFDRKTNPF